MGIPTREQAVWARVMAASAQAPVEPTPLPEPMPKCCTPMKQEQSTACLTPELLLDLMADERHDACTYEALASMASGRARRCLLDISRQEQCHFRTLGAVYFILTGQRACVAPPPCPRLGYLRDELRSQYQEEVEGAAKYRKIAETAGSFEGLFLCLACEEECHSRMILEMLM